MGRPWVWAFSVDTVGEAGGDRGSETSIIGACASAVCFDADNKRRRRAVACSIRKAAVVEVGTDIEAAVPVDIAVAVAVAVAVADAVAVTVAATAAAAMAGVVVASVRAAVAPASSDAHGGMPLADKSL